MNESSKCPDCGYYLDEIGHGGPIFAEMDDCIACIHLKEIEGVYNEKAS